jgi:hypothetical protein
LPEVTKTEGSATVAETAPAIRWPFWAELAIKGLATLVSLVVLGVSLRVTNNELQLPIVQHALDPRLFPGDPFVSTLPNYISVLWQVLWIPFRVLPETPLLLALTLIQRVFWLYAAGRLARAITEGSQIAELVTWCFCSFGMTPFVGWGTGLPDYFEQTSLAIACFMLALALVIEKRPTSAGWWLGLMGLCNVMHAAFGVVLLLAGLAVAPNLRSDRRGLARGAGLALLLMSPALGMAVVTASGPRIGSAPFLQLMWFYCPAHFFPSSWSGREWITLGLALVSVVFLCVVGQVRRSVRAMMLGLSAGTLVCLGVAAIAEIVRSASLVNPHPARACDVWTCVMAVFVAASLSDLMITRRRRWILAAGAAGLVCAEFLWRFHGRIPQPFDIIFLVAVCVLTTLVGWRGGKLRAGLAPLVPTFALMLLFSAIAVASPRPVGMAIFQPRPRDEIDLAEWAKRNSSVDAVFLVDPEWGGFRALAQRSSFVTWKEGAALLWYQPFAREWVRRIRALGVDPLLPGLRYPASRIRMTRAFAGLDDISAVGLARRFGLYYWLVPAGKPSGLPVVYANPTYKALRLNPGARP